MLIYLNHVIIKIESKILFTTFCVFRRNLIAKEAVKSEVFFYGDLNEDNP